MKKILTKWYFWIPIGIILTFFLTIEISNRSNSTLNPGEKNFAVLDTASITRIFLADKNNNTTLLERTDSAGWILNNKYSVQPEMLKELMYTIMYITVRNPIAKSMRDNVIKQLAGFSTKVEIYAKVFRINLFGLKLFPHEKRIRTYYVGASTQDNLGSYMLMENAEMPFVAHIPGFKGFLEPRYSPLEVDWRSHEIFKYKWNQIEHINVTYPSLPEHSFELKNPNNKNFVLNQNNKEINYDTTRIINYLNAFTDVRFEAFVKNMSDFEIDSVKQYKPFCIISVTDRNGKSNNISLIKIELPEGSLNLQGKVLQYDPERLYGIINGKELVLVQYFVFGSLMRYAEEFSKDYIQDGKMHKFETLL